METLLCLEEEAQLLDVGEARAKMQRLLTEGKLNE
jgi:hypothetical protein